ncbi:Rim13p [Lachancea thermotolerans CBS 6340]|uniref:Cysteine protease RIM13 n=1 Tax=Lachancea thermotolerans (strain ATCC 56472 / CBS 6340 / NRRL Y-8284) TaxID=559295 RepID=C5E3S8_LACTC|nr:KLTH0H16016p [Lachancea thermotolerans CBS 6340]CAR30689.1 KLTH0H16016p [Lachancea thermotolerans CBS 6340]
MSLKNAELAWKTLNDAIWNAQVLGKVDKTRWEEVRKTVRELGDDEISRAFTRHEECRGKFGFETRFLWLTSVLNGRRYPPVNADNGGPVSWNEETNETSSNRYASDQHAPITTCTDRTQPPPKQFRNPEIEQNSRISDCSFVASLINIRCQCPEYVKVSRVGSSSVFNVNLHFNGASNRLVRVKLSNIPSDSEGGRLAILSENAEDAALELAYFQIRNGSKHTFAGSNAAIDTFLLGGFVPEIYKIKEDTCNYIRNLLQKGICLVTLGTGQTVKSSQYLINHDYPVLGLDREGRIIVRDPLCISKTFPLNEQAFLENFNVAYVNWKCSLLFSEHQKVHFKYSAQKCNASMSLLNKPIFRLKNESKSSEPLWVLLERHLGNYNVKNNGCAVREATRDLYPLDTEKGSNTGFHLLKLTLEPGDFKYIYCHSDVSANFTLHLLHVSRCVRAERFNANSISASVEDEWNTATDHGPFSNPTYYMNPTFELIIDAKDQSTHYANIQLESIGNSLVNVQIFHHDDHDLTRPILFDGHYENKVHVRRAVPLSTGTPYKIICSAYEKYTNKSFRLSVTDPAEQCRLLLRRIYPQFGSRMYHTKHEFFWPQNSNRKKIEIVPSATMELQIRLLPLQFSSALSIRCNIFLSDTGQAILTNNDFSPTPRHGKVIEKFKVIKSQRLTLIIEKDGPSTISSDVPIRLEIGSDFEILLYDR